MSRSRRVPGRSEPVEASWQDALVVIFPTMRGSFAKPASARAADTPPPISDGYRSHRGRERAQTKQPGGHDWTAARGAVDQALALRGSRVALYDLRETLQRAKPGLLLFVVLAVVTIVGDDSCVEPSAAGPSHRPTRSRWVLELLQCARLSR